MKSLLVYLLISTICLTSYSQDNCCHPIIGINKIVDLTDQKSLKFLESRITMEGYLKELSLNTNDCPMDLYFIVVGSIGQKISSTKLEYEINVYLDFKSVDLDNDQIEITTSSIGNWLLRIEVFNLEKNEIVKSVTGEWIGPFIGDSLKDGETNGLENFDEVISTLIPLDDLIHKYEGKPVSVSIIPEKETIMTSEELTISVSDINSEDGPAKTWQYLIVETKEGQILNGSPIEENRKLIAISVEEARNNGLLYRASDDCDIEEDIIKISSTCEQRKEGCMHCNIYAIVAEYKVIIDPICRKWISERYQYSITYSDHEGDGGITTVSEEKMLFMINKNNMVTGKGYFILIEDAEHSKATGKGVVDMLAPIKYYEINGVLTNDGFGNNMMKGTRKVISDFKWTGYNSEWSISWARSKNGETGNLEYDQIAKAVIDLEKKPYADPTFAYPFFEIPDDYHIINKPDGVSYNRLAFRPIKNNETVKITNIVNTNASESIQKKFDSIKGIFEKKYGKIQ